MHSGRSLSIVSLVAFALFTSGSRAQQHVYHWVDAKGVSHYADAPPQGMEEGAREMVLRSERAGVQGSPAVPATPTVGAASAAAVAGKPSNQAMCERARKNIAALQGTQDVVMDVDGDGKNELLDAAQRADQLKRAQAALGYYCE